MISWSASLIVGLLSALVVVGIGGISTILKSRRTRNNIVLDMALAVAATIILLALYVVSQSEGDDTLRLSVGCAVAALSTSGAKTLRDWINRKFN